MSYYFMASITIQDHDEYQEYLDRADEIFARYNGTYLAGMTTRSFWKENGIQNGRS